MIAACTASEPVLKKAPVLGLRDGVDESAREPGFQPDAGG
jgi:hypothetical protein